MTSTRTAASRELAARNAKIKKAHRKGRTYRQIAEQFELTPLRVKDIITDPYSDLPPQKPTFKKVKVSDIPWERNRQMKDLREQGATLEQIGDMFKVTRERVRQIVSNPNSDRPRAVKQPSADPDPDAVKRPVGRPRKQVALTE